MLLFVSLVIILFALIALIYNFKENRSIIYLSTIFLLFSTFSLTYHYLFYGDEPILIAIFYGHFSPLWFLIGPFTYFYVRSVLENNKSTFYWTDLLHCLPTFIHLASFSKYYFIPFNQKLDFANHVIHNLNYIHHLNTLGYFYSQKFAFLIRPIHGFAYSIGTLLYFLKVNKQKRSNQIQWILFFLITMALISFYFIFLFLLAIESSNLNTTFNYLPIKILTEICFLSIPIAILIKFPEILYGKNKFAKTKPEPKSETYNLSFETEENKLIATQIINFFETNSPYLNPDFEFQDLQKALKLSEEELKISLKYILKKKFTELRSEYRINHAKGLIKSGLTQNTSIDGIGTLSGFSNRANFYSTFKLLSGLTPSQYLLSLSKEKTKNN